MNSVPLGQHLQEILVDRMKSFPLGHLLHEILVERTNPFPLGHILHEILVERTNFFSSWPSFARNPGQLEELFSSLPSFARNPGETNELFSCWPFFARNPGQPDDLFSSWPPFSRNPGQVDELFFSWPSFTRSPGQTDESLPLWPYFARNPAWPGKPFLSTVASFQDVVKVGFRGGHWQFPVFHSNLRVFLTLLLLWGGKGKMIYLDEEQKYSLPLLKELGCWESFNTTDLSWNKIYYSWTWMFGNPMGRYQVSSLPEGNFKLQGDHRSLTVNSSCLKCLVKRSGFLSGGGGCQTCPCLSHNRRGSKNS